MLTAFSDPFRRCGWPTLLSLSLPWCLAVSLPLLLLAEVMRLGGERGQGSRAGSVIPVPCGSTWQPGAVWPFPCWDCRWLSAICRPSACVLSLGSCGVCRALLSLSLFPSPSPPCLSLLQVCVCPPHCLSLAGLSHSACLSYSWLFIALARPLWLLPPGMGEPCPLSLGVFGYCPRSQGQHAAIRPPHPAATAQGSAQAASSSEVHWLQEKQACSFLSRSAQQ